MSRSRKKHPVIKANRGTKKWWKKYANNVCKQHDIPNGSAYKHLVDQWNFCDYKWSMLGASRRDSCYNGSSKYGWNFDEDMFTCRRK